MIGFLAKKDSKSALSLISSLANQNTDMKYFLDQVIGELHNMLLVKVGVLESLGSKIENLLDMEEIKKIVELLVKAHMEFRYSALPQLPL